MRRYRFLVRPRWFASHLLVVIAVATFVGLGFWQLRRLEQRQERNQLLERRLSSDPQPLSDLLFEFLLDLPPEDESSAAYRLARLSGRYDPGHEVLLRTTESYEGEPGYQVLTPLVLEEGQAILIERGWVPFEMNTPPVAEAAPVNIEVSLTGILTPTRTAPQDWRSAFAPRDPPGVLEVTAYTDTGRLEEQMPYDLLPVYVRLLEQTPPQAGLLPVSAERPTFSDGPHLGYAIQWFGFAVITLFGYGLLLRQQVVMRQLLK